MKHSLSAGHEQLFEAECSGLFVAWRRVAEESQHGQQHRTEAVAQPMVPRRRDVHAALAAAVASVVVVWQAIIKLSV